ncbi:MAG: TIGR02444 family protein [Pseudomonas sp.]|uniref:TIGR02444 family protein n=1 Tax=Pseudomonas sp. TaxID=306 RepID=UPI003395CF95
MSTDLWRFAQRLYAQPGVEDACLQLQAEGQDVCLLLCCAWLERHGVPCGVEYLETLQAVAEPWQEEVIRPLRQLRQHWRAPALDDPSLGQLREQVKQLELAAEQQLLQRLDAVSRTWGKESVTPLGGSWLHNLKGNRDALELVRVAAAAV